MAAFAENLKEARKKRGMTQQQLGAAIGVTGQGVISSWENYGVIPRGERLVNLARALDVSVPALLGYEPLPWEPRPVEVPEGVKTKRHVYVKLVTPIGTVKQQDFPPTKEGMREAEGLAKDWKGLAFERLQLVVEWTRESRHD